MGEQPHYEKAPITEAIIDLRVSFAEPIEMTRLEAAFSQEQEQYPGRKRLQQGMGQFEFGPRISSSATTEDLGFAFTSVDEKQVAQFRRNGFTFSRLTPYESWGPFSGEARRLWDVYRKGLSPNAITRLAVRYINRIQLPPSIDDISHWLKTYPEVAEGVSKLVAGFFMHVTVPLPELKGALALIETVDERRLDKGDGVAIILDLDLFRTADVPQDEESIWAYFEELHVRKNQVFEACLTDKTRELFQ
ncbi:MAG: TIGR04255 family protein [Fimbriimonadaceae bacterium]|nr:TIGR04255 family protein [Fimbriimonadaceae bacterium]